MESQLVVSSIWEDESLFEISIFGSNGQFSGQADCYTNREEVNQLGRLLEKFPRTTKDELEFKSRSTPDLSYFSIHAFCTDNSGHTMFAVTIAHIESFTNVRNENYKVNFDMKVEPQTICNFGIQLQRLAVNPLGKTKAVLKNAI